jgi:signal transduction histidine kinase
VERGVLVGAAGLRWASWIWLAVVALANLHRVHHAPLAVAAVALTGAATVAATIALRDGAWQRSLRPGWVGAELAVAAAVVAADGWVEQGRLTGQTLAGSWPVPTILVAALAGGMTWGVGSGALLAGGRAIAVAVSGWAPGQTGRVWLAVVSTSIEWIAFGAASAVVIRLLRRTHRQLAEAEVRDRIARDLHDGVLQTLTLIERRSPSPEIARLARDQERDLRAYLFGDYQDQASLGAVLRSAAGRFERSWPGTIATVTVSDDVADRKGPTVEAVGGAVTEALTNAAKHGRATGAVVFADVDESSGGLFVSVKDDGCGFDPGTVTEGVGMAQSIRGRIEHVGGTVAFASAGGEGAEVRITIPVAERKPSWRS